MGTLVPDMIVDDLVITDPKVVTAFNDTHEAQMIGYLNVTTLQLALLLNFKFAQLKWQRIVNEQAVASRFPVLSPSASSA